MATEFPILRTCAALVLPPGHGKTTLHNPAIGLYELDQLVHWNETPELRALRRDAKRSGDWTEYDITRIKILETRAKPYIMVLVPTRFYADRSGMAYRGTCYLNEVVYRRNMSPRGIGAFNDCNIAYMLAKREGILMGTNEETTQWVKAQLALWIKIRNLPADFFKHR